MRRLAPILLACLLATVLWPARAEGQQTAKFNVDCWNFEGICNICPRPGHEETGKNYDCSWWWLFQQGCVFPDPLPPDTFVSQIQADLLYLWAADRETEELGYNYTLWVNGTPLATEYVDGPGTCGDCAIQTFLSPQYPEGFPNYDYASDGSDYNYLGVPKPPAPLVICVESADVTLFYHPQDPLIIEPEETLVPSGSTLEQGRLRTKSTLSLALGASSGLSREGLTIVLESDRDEMDTITQPGPTDANGDTTAVCETTDQLGLSGISHITGSSLRVRTAQPGFIVWLPADYETLFYTTCYSTELESDYSGSFVSWNKWTWCDGVTPSSAEYRRQFMRRVKFQGSGIAIGGEVIQYTPSGRCYYESTCPLTASGQCAIAGTTIAVDLNVVPFRGDVFVDQLGSREALDTGGAINGYDIDVYNGSGTAACAGWDNADRAVSFLSY